jgi:outer membrane lipoprotein-sorting protein
MKKQGAHKFALAAGGLKGRYSAAQGKALGSDVFWDQALKGRNKRSHARQVLWCRPFRAWLNRTVFPGLCPGLSNRAPLGLTAPVGFAFAIIAVLFMSVTAMMAADSPLAPVTDPAPILQDLQRKMSSLRSVYLDFTQERHLKLFTEPLKSEGVMLMERPNQIRWETTAPYQSILLGNEKSVAQFERTDGQWKKLKLGFPQMLKRVMEQMSLMHQGKLDALTRDFTMSVSTGAVAVVTLVPKDQAVREMLGALELRMLADFSATREVVMREPSGEFTRIIFTRERRDVKLPAGTFDQTKPADIATIKAAVGDGP